MEMAEEEEEDQTQTSKKPGAKPNSIPFTVPENRLLSELYLANKIQYHAKSRAVVGEKNGETSQERFANQFAGELTKLGFAHRTSAQVKQRIADIRKLGHKLIIKEREKCVDSKKRKKVFVEPWLRNVMDALTEELQETLDSQGSRKRIGQTDVDNMSVMAQTMLDRHLQTKEEGSKKKKKERNEKEERASSLSGTLGTNSPSASETVQEPEDMDTSTTLFSTVSSSRISSIRVEEMTTEQTQKKLLDAQLRVALKKERLLDLKIKKMEFELALTANAARFRQGVFQSENSEGSGDDDETWQDERTETKILRSDQPGGTAEIQENSAALIESLLIIKNGIRNS